MNPASVIALVAAVILPPTLCAQSTTYSQAVEADTYVSSGQPTVNFGTKGAMEIAVPTGTQPRTQESLLRFNTAAMRASFDADYGPVGWMVTGVTLSLFSNYATAGEQPGNVSFNQIAAGSFEFDLLSNNDWNETSITWDTLPGILPGAGNQNTLTSLGTFFWAATGERSSTWTLNNDSSLANLIYNGNEVTIFGQPTLGSTVGYLFNSSNGGPGYLNVTVTAVPEPSTELLTLSSIGAIAVCSLRRKKNLSRTLINTGA